MYRYRNVATVKYGHYREVYELSLELRQEMIDRGLAAPRYWVPTVGQANQLVMEIEYPDLATYERETNAFMTDADMMKTVRRITEHLIEGSVTDEIWEEAIQIA